MDRTAASMEAKLLGEGVLSSGQPFIRIHMREVKEWEVGPLSYPTRGILVHDIVENSPAKQAGIKKEDLIIEVDDQRVDRVSQFQRLISAKQPGDSITLTIVRGRKKKKIDVVLGEIRVYKSTSATGEEPSSEARGLGMIVGDLTNELAEELGYKSDRGVVVLGVEPSSPASKAGIHQGDLKVGEVGQGLQRGCCQSATGEKLPLLHQPGRAEAVRSRGSTVGDKKKGWECSNPQCNFALTDQELSFIKKFWSRSVNYEDKFVQEK